MPTATDTREKHLAADRRAPIDAQISAVEMTRLRRHADGDDAGAMEPVDHLAGDQHQRERRQELEQADQAEIPGAVRQVVHLPAEGDQQHLVGGRCRTGARTTAA